MSGNPFVVERRPFFSPDQLERIEEAALRILDEVGIRVLDEGPLDAFRRSWATTNTGWNRAFNKNWTESWTVQGWNYHRPPGPHGRAGRGRMMSVAFRTEKSSSPENTRYTVLPSVLIHFVGNPPLSPGPTSHNSV